MAGAYEVAPGNSAGFRVRQLTRALDAHRGAVTVVRRALPFLRDLSPTRWVELDTNGLHATDAP